jgi:hypothetical protein
MYHFHSSRDWILILICERSEAFWIQIEKNLSNYAIVIYKIETDIYQEFTLAYQKFFDINISSPIGFITVPLSNCVISCLQNRDHKQFHWTRSLLNFLLTTQLIHTKDNKLQDTLLQLQEKQETTEQLPSPNKRQQLNKDNAQRTTSDRGDQQPKKKIHPYLIFISVRTVLLLTHKRNRTTKKTSPITICKKINCLNSIQQLFNTLNLVGEESAQFRNYQTFKYFTPPHVKPGPDLFLWQGLVPKKVKQIEKIR